MIQGGQQDCFARLAAVQRRLSPKGATLAAFISERHVQAAFMSSRELAAAAGVSLATVVRLARTLGYPSFEALRTSLQERVNFDLTGVERLRTLPSQNRSPAALLRRIVDGDLASLRALAHTFSEPQFERFVDAIIGARRVMILGFRYLGPLASYFSYSLGKIKSARRELRPRGLLAPRPHPAHGGRGRRRRHRARAVPGGSRHDAAAREQGGAPRAGDHR